LNQNRALVFCFEAFSSREPVSTSLENALGLIKPQSKKAPHVGALLPGCGHRRLLRRTRHYETAAAAPLASSRGAHPHVAFGAAHRDRQGSPPGDRLGSVKICAVSNLHRQG
jgi:hypothetical protein